MSDTVLNELLAQEKELIFPRFTDVDAWEIGSWLVKTARERGLVITIDIARNGHRLFHYAFDGTSPDNEQWIKGKTAVVNRCGHSSFYVGMHLDDIGRTQEDAKLLPLVKYAAHGGGFPLNIENVGPVGHIAVSGLPSADDHALVVEALRAHKARISD